MLFNSIEFAIFFAFVFLVYWLALRQHLRWQNFFILLVSYLFYGWWDYRFLALIVASSLVDYTIGLRLYASKENWKRKTWLWLSLVFNLGMLGFFKYYNFFVQSFVDAFQFLGIYLELGSLEILLPVGISFYTFQTMSYTIDIYRKQLQPTKDIVAFFAFVAFFPQLVAGPIERASKLLPQFYKKRVFDYDLATDGMRQALWGLFKKTVVADNCVAYVNEIFMSTGSLPASMLIIGAILFTFQIYCDFSGYSDIAIGTARILGFRLSRNFAYPFFSRNLSEFWQKWHISLISWFRDYVYIALGGNRKGQFRMYFNLLLVFVISGLWHGADYTFLIWGLANALFVIFPLIFFKKKYKTSIVAGTKSLPSFIEMLQMLSTFFIFAITAIFFRCENYGHSKLYFKGLLRNDFYNTAFNFNIYIPFIPIVFMLVIEWIQRHQEHPLIFNTTRPKYQRWLVYYLFALIIFIFRGSQQEFIYFQF